jgi:hypothetical protein
MANLSLVQPEYLSIVYVHPESIVLLKYGKSFLSTARVSFHSTPVLLEYGDSSFLSSTARV